MEKTFYIETFGCRMNAHDSEKVVGTLIQQGYRQVETVEEAGYVFYESRVGKTGASSPHPPTVRSQLV